MNPSFGGPEAELDQPAVEELSERLANAVIRPGDAGYDQARQAWNLAVDQHPALIVKPVSAEEVSAAVRFGGEQGLGVAVQATGHGISRPADGALLILTAGLNELRVDAGAKTAWVGAGLPWGPVLARAQESGLAPLLGSSPTVGAVGYTLGGGVGWLGRKFGLGCDAVNAFEVVLANGEIIRASANENQELFWGLRGSAGSLGIITAMEINLYPVQTVYGGNLLYPIARAEEVLTRYREWIETLPDEMTSSVLLLNVPPLPDLPDFLRGNSFAVVRGCYCGPAQEGAALVDEWRNWQEPAVDMFQEMPFGAVAGISMDPEGPVSGAGTGAWVDGLSDGLIEAIVAYTAPQGGPPPLIYTELRHLGGAVGRTDLEQHSVGHRDTSLLLHTIGMSPLAMGWTSGRLLVRHNGLFACVANPL